MTATCTPPVPRDRKAGSPGAPANPLDAVRQVLPVLAEHAPVVDRDAAFPEVALDALRRSGLMGLLVPKEHGGMGADLTAMSAVARQLAGECTSTAAVWAMHCQQVAAVVRAGDPELRADVLPRIARGEVYIASVTTERGKGGHLLTAEAPLRHLGGGRVLLQRDAPISTGALHADAFLVTMRASPDAAPSDVRLVWADRRDLTLQTHSDWDPMGMRGTHSVAVTLLGELDERNVISDFREVALGTFVPAGHVAWASCWLGAAQGALRRALTLLRDPRQRRQFDLASDLLVTRLARVRLELDVVEAFLDRVLVTLRETSGSLAEIERPEYQIMINDLKLVASERALRAVDDLVELLGLRHGYLRSSPTGLERVLRDLRSASLMYANDRLLLANGRLTLLDRAARLP